MEILQKYKDIIGIAVLAAVIFVAYSPAMKAGFIWDDDDM